MIPPKLVTVISEKDSQKFPGLNSEPVIVHRKVVIPELFSASCIVEVGELGKSIVTPAPLLPSIVHSPDSPGLEGTLPVITKEPELSGHDSILEPASALVIDSIVINTS